MWYSALAFIITLLAIVLLLKTRMAFMALDKPNQRSLHSKITPRTGGIAIMAGVIAVWYLLGDVEVFIIPIVVLMTVSLVDDIQGLPVLWRLLAQLAMSAAFVTALIPDAPWLLIMPLVIAITWMINLYNFMDGSDGLSGGMALFGFGFYAIAAYLADQPQLGALCAVIAAANLAFLFFNFHPARIFMGDAGSIPLGFLAGSLGLYGWQHGIWPLWFPVLVFSSFIIDATVTLVKRLLCGENLWQAHHDHYYQRLIRLGWGHRKTAIVEYLLMVATGVSALVILQEPANQVVAWLSLWLIIYLLLAYFIDKVWKSFNQG